MTELQERIDQLEDQANDAELIGLLACDVETRERNQRLAYALRVLALSTRCAALATAG